MWTRLRIRRLPALTRLAFCTQERQLRTFSKAQSSDQWVCESCGVALSETPTASSRPEPQLRIAIAPATIWLLIWATIGSLLVLLFLKSIFEVVLLLFAAITIAEAMRPAVRWMRRYYVPRWLGVLLLYLLAFAILGGLGYLVSQPLADQITQFATQLPQLITDLTDQVRSAQGVLNQFPGGNAIPTAMGTWLQGLGPLVLSIPTTIVNIASDLVIVLFMALFWVAYTDGLREFFLGFFPPQLRRTGADVLDEMGQRLGGYVRGVIINMFVIGALAGGADWLLGLPYALLLGIFAGLVEVIPLLGPFIGAAPAVIIAFTLSPGKGFLVALIYFLIQEFEGNTLVPLVMNRAVKLSPLTILVAFSIGALLEGLLGALLAVPFAAVVQVFFLRVLTPWIRSTTGGDHHDTTTEEATAAPQEEATEEAAPTPALSVPEESTVAQENLPSPRASTQPIVQPDSP